MVSGAQWQFRIDQLFPELPAGRSVPLQTSKQLLTRGDASPISVGKSLHLISDCLPPFIISLQLGTSQSLPLVKDMRHSLCLISGSHCVQFVHLPTDLAHQVSVFPICMSLASTALSRAARNQTIGVFCLIRAQLSNFPAPALW